MGKTEICISIAERPSTFGITVHNAAYRALGLDFLYKALKIDNVEQVMIGVRALQIRGCSVSMPFKERVIPYLDSLDSLAQQVGAVNTILNQNGYLKGFNTDVNGAYEVLKSLKLKNDDSILLLGAGGVSRAIIVAMKMLNLNNITVSSRNKMAREELESSFGIVAIPWDLREEVDAECLINATPIGMAPEEEMLPVSQDSIAKYNKIFDVVASPPESKLVKIAKKFEVETINGLTMTLCQAAKQFAIYTGKEAPVSVMREAALSLYASSHSRP